VEAFERLGALVKAGVPNIRIPTEDGRSSSLAEIEELAEDEAVGLRRFASGSFLRREYPLELYSYNVRPAWSVQPDFQYIVHPGGYVQASSVVILGLRTDLEF
jgi:Carbohydrate-selective porin, OprB family